MPWQGRVADPLTLEATMNLITSNLNCSGAIRTDLGAIFVSLELSKTKWLVTAIVPGCGEKMSKHTVEGGDLAGLFDRFEKLREKARARLSKRFPIIAIQEAGLDGFWIHRALRQAGIESHIVDPSSIAMPRRPRRAKTDRIDGETLVRTLLAFKRGEPRVCSMVRDVTPQQEDRRRLIRERRELTAERVRHVNRIKGLLFSQGITGYEPLHRDRRKRLAQLRTGDGRDIGPHLKAQLLRELDRLELNLRQIAIVNDERRALVLAADKSGEQSSAAKLLEIKGIGPDFAAILWTEGLFRHFDNRRQVAAYAGLAPTPWQSGAIRQEQGISKAGNPRLRATLIQLAWLWLRHQPGTALSQWFQERIRQSAGRLKKAMIAALARKLIVALWRYATQGVVIEGVILKGA
jgi:transposase